MLEWLFSNPLPVGSLAPDFSALDEQGRSVTLSALRGNNVVLVFYPADDTTICTKQLCEFRDSWPAVEAANAVVFGVNPAGKARHDKFRSKCTLPFPLLVDERRAIARKYNACSGPIIKRTVYLIGPDGTIRYARRGKPQPEEVLKAAA